MRKQFARGALSALMDAGVGACREEHNLEGMALAETSSIKTERSHEIGFRTGNRKITAAKPSAQD
jgi:hypothetical protein